MFIFFSLELMSMLSLSQNKVKNVSDKMTLSNKGPNDDMHTEGMPAPLLTRISSGSDVIDRLTSLGFETDIITTVYGPAGSGKTNLCILFAKSLASLGKKVIYIDTENNFSLERLKQLAPDDYRVLLDNMVFLKPVNFQEQKKVFERLKDMITPSIGAIIVDSLSMLYRLEIGQSSNVYDVNRELGQQLSFLSEMTRKNNIPVLLTNQVYQSFDEKEKVNIVGGDILKYGSKCLIEFQKYHNSFRKAILRKHRSQQEGKEVVFRIIASGFEHIQETKETKQGYGYYNDDNSKEKRYRKDNSII